LRQPAPADCLPAVRAAVRDDDESRHRARCDLADRRDGGMPAAVVACVCALPAAGHDQVRLADELVAAHLRFADGGSIWSTWPLSNQHTVKPWFTAA